MKSNAKSNARKTSKGRKAIQGEKRSVIATEEGGKRKIITTKDVCERVGCSRSTIRRQEIAGDFPQRVRRGRRGVGYFEDEVEEHINTSERVNLVGSQLKGD